MFAGFGPSGKCSNKAPGGLCTRSDMNNSENGLLLKGHGQHVNDRFFAA